MAEKKTIKLEDVAELAGVSKTTVSRVLNKEFFPYFYVCCVYVL